MSALASVTILNRLFQEYAPVEFERSVEGDATIMHCTRCGKREYFSDKLTKLADTDVVESKVVEHIHCGELKRTKEAQQRRSICLEAL